MIAVMVFTDGRDRCLRDTLRSFDERVRDGAPTLQVIHDDSGDPRHRRTLRLLYPEWVILPTDVETPRRGFGGAIAHAWETLLAWNDAAVDRVTHVFHLEDDFTFRRDVPLAQMVQVLDEHPYLAQLALRRQPWSTEEIAAGGVVEQWPDEYVDRQSHGAEWLEHRLFFTTNPSLYRVGLCERGWPDQDGSEAEFTRRVLEDPGARFGYWGARSSGEWVEHIGRARVGTGY